MDTASITTRIDQRLHKKLARAARSRRRSQADIMREALEAYLESPQPSRADETCYDLAIRHGMIGVSEDLPSDLSRNPSHFEGFGK